MQDGLVISVSTDDGVVVHVAGALDMATAPKLRSVLTPLVTTRAAPGQRVCVDLSRVDFCDSSGLAVFVNATTLARAADTSVEFHAASAQLRRIFAISGVDQYLEVGEQCVTGDAP